MPRIYHPDAVRVLDDERLQLAHQDTHRVMQMIDGLRDWPGEGKPPRGWQDPEVIAHLTHPEHVGYIHDLCVKQMRYRGFPSGIDHATPSEEPATDSFVPYLDYLDPGFRYKVSSDAWLDRDLVDLLARWTEEGRFTASETFLGRKVAGAGGKTPTYAVWQAASGTPHYAKRDSLLAALARVGPERGPYDNLAMKERLARWLDSKKEKLHA